ncbi:MAG: class I SAM-dependent methyltransferase [Microcoleaceae cyanobacterium]
MERILEPEVMDTWEEAIDYDSMDFTEVNTVFAQSAINLGPKIGKILDAGTGTARIPIIIAKISPQWHLTCIDLSANMLKVGAINVENAGVTSQVKLELVDAKQMPYHNHEFDMVISNSIIHHLPDPLPFLREVKRVLKPDGGLFLRDLLRPQDRETRDNLVEMYAGDCNERQKQLFRDSLHAAFSLAEITHLLAEAGLTDVKIYQSSDRHWSVEKAWMDNIVIPNKNETR